MREPGPNGLSSVREFMGAETAFDPHAVGGRSNNHNSCSKSCCVSVCNQHKVDNKSNHNGCSELVPELFPLPQFQDRDHSEPRTRRSRCRHSQRLVEANEAVDARNWLGAPGMIHQGLVSAAQRSALKHHLLATERRESSRHP